MSGDVVPLHRCVCGAQGQLRTAACGADTATFVACDECMKTSVNLLASVRPIFEMMLICGVPRDVANDTMTFMLERMPS